MPSLALVTLALTFHFAMTWIYNSPDNIIKTSVSPILTAYMSPLLFQNWSFFAPQPIDRDLTVLARGESADGKITPWLDTLSYFVGGLQTNRLSHREMSVTSIENAILDTNSIMVDMDNLGGDLNYYEFASPRLLYRVGADCLQYRYPTAKFNAVQVGIIASEFPRFPHRREQLTRTPTKLAPLPWHAFPDVQPLP